MPQYSEEQYSESHYSEALYWSIVFVDVAGFTHPRRSPGDILTVHQGLTKLVKQAFTDADIEWASCVVEDRGDGKLILVPSSVPRIRLADRLWDRLLAGLRRYNAEYSETASIQLRVALHAGEVRVSPDGMVGTAINFAARILNAAPAKKALDQTKSMLALLVSENFFDDVIEADQAAAPDEFDRIRFEVGGTVATARMRLSKRDEPQPQAPAPAAAARVLPQLSDQEMNRLAGMLTGLDVPALRAVIGRVAGHDVQAALPGDDAWSVVWHLAEFNAGPDGLPPVMLFVELLARQVGDRSLRDRLRAWNDRQANTLELMAELAHARSSAAPIAADVRLHLMIVVQPDGIETDRYMVCAWRQSDPDEWPPPREEAHAAREDEIEQLIDELVLDAERAWQGHTGTAALEIVLPRKLLRLPVHLWHKEHVSGNPRPLCLEYSVVVRSLERMVTDYWHRAWKRRWRTLQDDPRQADVHFARPAGPDSPYAIDAVLESEELCTAIVLSGAPSPEPGKADQLTAALRSGLPAVLWHRLDADEASIRRIVDWLADGDGLRDLPTRSHVLRRDAHRDDVPRFDGAAVLELFLLWDDPTRLLTPDELMV